MSFLMITTNGSLSLVDPLSDVLPAELAWTAVGCAGALCIGLA